MSNYWIFGSSKSLGSALCKSLKKDHNITCFSRTVPLDWPDTIKIDFSDLEATQCLIKHYFLHSPPDGVVFCQRYRPFSDEKDLSAIKSGLNIELGPVLSFLSVAREIHSQEPISVVLLSSVAGTCVNPDIEFYYHILKSITIAATRVLAIKFLQIGIRINCLILGEFLKYNRSEYTPVEQMKFSYLEQVTLSNRVCNLDDITAVISFLLSDGSRYITGELISLDGGLSKISSESILRSHSRI